VGKKEIAMTWKPIVGKHFKPDGFATYVYNLQMSDWHPTFCVLHNTAVPNLAQRPHGRHARDTAHLLGKETP